MGVNYSCCDSCHDDEDEGYNGLLEKEFRNQEFEICCRGHTEIEKIEKLSGGEAAENPG